MSPVNAFAMVPAAKKLPSLPKSFAALQICWIRKEAETLTGLHVMP